MHHHNLSLEYYKKAQEVIPGGVNSPVRACKSVGRNPVFIESGEGCFLKDADGNEYVDYVCSWGPMILGHGHPDVLGAVGEAMHQGMSFGAPTWREVALAEKITECVPSIEKVRLVSSGTEATMSAIRLARGFTGKKKIIKFDGCYHGHADSFLVKAGSGVATLGIPGSPGVPEEIVANTIALPYNQLEPVEDVLKNQDDIAAIIVEPVAANMGVVLPAEGFLEGLRELTRQHDVLLIFDEVITGFRLGLGGAQEAFGVMPDLTCLGKIIGGGMPVGAYGGRADVMDYIAPDGPVYQAGTLSGNPLATAAGLATLEVLSRPGVYSILEERASVLSRSIEEIAERHSIKCCVQAIGSMMTCFFGVDCPVTDFEAALKADTEGYAKYYNCMLEEGIYLAPSQFEAAFVSLAHNWPVIEHTINIIDKVFEGLAG